VIVIADTHQERVPQNWLRYGLILAPLICLAVTFALPPLERTQEARVLETAREMLDGDWRQWMIPRLNGHVRLQKPPLAYWLVALSFRTFGVSVWAGRLPMAVAAVSTLVVVYRMGRWLFNDVAASFAWATISGSLLFCRLGLHAETDTLATLFVTAAVYAMWRAWSAARQTMVDQRREPSDFWWHHLAAAGTAMALLAKGAPAIFPPLFLLGLVFVNGGWRVLWRFCATGAVITFAALAAPWFLYVSTVPGAKVLASELSVVVEGHGHDHGPWFYLLHVFTQTSPWQGFLALALVAAAGAARGGDVRVRGLLTWLFVVIVPLTFLGQKQEHYLMFALPPVALLVGWAVGRALSGDDEPLLRGFGWVAVGTIAVAVIAAPVPLLVGMAVRGRSVVLDLVLSASVAAVAAIGWRAHGRRGAPASIPVLATAGAILVNLAVSAWAATLGDTTYADLATELQRRFGDRPVAFYGSENLPLVFYMRRIIPEFAPEELESRLAREPGWVVVAARPDAETRRRLAPLERVLSVVIDRHYVDVYQLARASKGNNETLGSGTATTRPIGAPTDQGSGCCAPTRGQ
jgi:4-amino-4-deoxy-L-arabinose transferase-like glycosyltransferase